MEENLIKISYGICSNSAMSVDNIDVWKLSKKSKGHDIYLKLFGITECWAFDMSDRNGRISPDRYTWENYE